MPPLHRRFPPQVQADIVLHEYEALYALIQLRLGALEKRAMLAWAALGAFITGLASLPPEYRLAIAVATPPALVWLFRTTVNHARSLEDAFRRVEAVERHINRLAGVTLLAFQSRHPSRGRAVGGRTGSESIFAVLTTAFIVLVFCGLFVWPELHQRDPRQAASLIAYLWLVAAYLGYTVWRWGRYRYQPESSTES